MVPLHYLAAFFVIFLINWSVLQGQPVVTSHGPDDASIRTAKMENIHKYMNLSADPCDDFYKFACGNWHIHNPATKETKQTSVFLETEKFFTNQIAILLANNDTADTEIIQKPKNFYRSCMNVSHEKIVYRDQLIAIVNEFGKMPLLEGDKWRAEDFDWLKIIAEIAYKYDITILLGFTIRPDFLDITKKASALRHFEFPLVTLAMYLNETNKSYRDEHQEKIAAHLQDFLGVEPNAAKQTASDIMELTILLAKGANENTYPEGEACDVTSVVALQEKYAGRLDVKKLMKISLGSVPNFRVMEWNPSYQEHLIDLVNHYDKRKIANFIFYYLLWPFMVFARVPATSRQEHCVARTRLVFSDLVENIMYHKLNMSQAETAVRNIFADLKSVFQSALASSRYRWISESTRSYAVEKLRRITIKVESYDDINFIQKYGNLNITPHDFLENTKSIFAQRGVETRAKITTPFQGYPIKKLLLTPAFYQQENSVHIPVITLLPHVLWSQSYPNAVNLAQLGFAIGHEIVHAFDDHGQNFDKHGNFQDWWDLSSLAEFVNRTQCFVDQYKKYNYGGKPLPEQKVQKENIADNGGLRLAYEAYMTLYNSTWHPHMNADWETLAPLPFSGQQLFFISCAQQWCHDTHPYYMNMVTSTDNHTPANLRVIGSFSNMEEFSDVFQCASGSGMNPLHKCRIY